MNVSTAILGSTVAKELTARARAAILTIGRDSFDRATLAGIGCYSFVAAANLSKILNSEMRVKDTRDVYERIAPEALVLPRLGAISLAVLGAAFEAKGIGGEAPLETWYLKHHDKGAHVITFAALKSHEKKEKPRSRSRGR